MDAVLLSGGVDSSVALMRHLDQHGASGLRAYYLKIWLEDELASLGACPWEEDLAYVRAVVDRVGVPLEVVPLQREYFDRVVAYTIEELRAGRTPSPDLFCNQRIKFGAFLDYVDQAERVITGHYARIERGARVRLAMAPDPIKDQTYFLSELSPRQLARAEFPVGAMRKREVRDLAARLGLPNRARPDSQGICFLGKIRYPEFVRHYLGTRAGTIRDSETGHALGTHQGVWFYTIGQRQGLGLGNGPWYVVDKAIDDNTVWVSHARSVRRFSRSRFSVGELNWLAGPPQSDRLKLKLRHGPDLIDCRIVAAGERCTVTIDRADRGVAAGQFAVFYDPPYCLGAGKILEHAA